MCKYLRSFLYPLMVLVPPVVVALLSFTCGAPVVSSFPSTSVAEELLIITMNTSP